MNKGKMKKVIALSALMAAIGFGGLPATANAAESNASAVGTTANAVEPQIRVQIGRGRNRNVRRVRTVTQTRIVRRGFRTYRETYRITYLPNGRTQTRLISRTRLR